MRRAEKSRKRGRRGRKGWGKHSDRGQIEMWEYLYFIQVLNHSWTLCQFYPSCQKRGYHLNSESFFVSEYYRKVCIKSRKLGFENCKIFIASQTPPFQTRKICKVLLIICKQFLHVLINNTRNAGPTKIWMSFLNFLRQFDSR